MIVAPILYMIHNAMTANRFDDILIFEGQTQDKCLARDVFNDAFITCIGKNFDEIDSDFKTYLDLTHYQEHICLLPVVELRIKSFVQWVRDKVKTGRNSATSLFPVSNTPILIKRHKTYG